MQDGSFEPALEFKAQDGAWYAGTPSFCEDRCLNIHFEGFPKEDDENWHATTFTTANEARTKIRILSQPMQDSQCKSITKGLALCAACRIRRSNCFQYYDAVVQRVRRSKHGINSDGEEHCNCVFVVTWISGPLVGKSSNVYCGDICFLSPGRIEDNLAIRAFLEAIVANLKAGDIQHVNKVVVDDAENRSDDDDNVPLKSLLLRKREGAGRYHYSQILRNKERRTRDVDPCGARCPNRSEDRGHMHELMDNSGPDKSQNVIISGAGNDGHLVKWYDVHLLKAGNGSRLMESAKKYASRQTQCVKKRKLVVRSNTHFLENASVASRRNINDAEGCVNQQMESEMMPYDKKANLQHSCLSNQMRCGPDVLQQQRNKRKRTKRDLKLSNASPFLEITMTDAALSKENSVVALIDKDAVSQEKDLPEASKNVRCLDEINLPTIEKVNAKGRIFSERCLHDNSHSSQDKIGEREVLIVRCPRKSSENFVLSSGNCPSGFDSAVEVEVFLGDDYIGASKAGSATGVHPSCNHENGWFSSLKPCNQNAQIGVNIMENETCHDQLKQKVIVGEEKTITHQMMRDNIHNTEKEHTIRPSEGTNLKNLMTCSTICSNRLESDEPEDVLRNQYLGHSTTGAVPPCNHEYELGSFQQCSQDEKMGMSIKENLTIQDYSKITNASAKGNLVSGERIWGNIYNHGKTNARSQLQAYPNDSSVNVLSKRVPLNVDAVESGDFMIETEFPLECVNNTAVKKCSEEVLPETPNSCPEDDEKSEKEKNSTTRQGGHWTSPTHVAAFCLGNSDNTEVDLNLNSQLKYFSKVPTCLKHSLGSGYLTNYNRKSTASSTMGVSNKKLSRSPRINQQLAVPVPNKSSTNIFMHGTANSMKTSPVCNHQNKHNIPNLEQMRDSINDDGDDNLEKHADTFSPPSCIWSKADLRMHKVSCSCSSVTDCFKRDKILKESLYHTRRFPMHPYDGHMDAIHSNEHLCSLHMASCCCNGNMCCKCFGNYFCMSCLPGLYSHKLKCKCINSGPDNACIRSHLLLIENMEKDITPGDAIEILSKVSNGVLSVVILPSLEYEITRRGYACYQDSRTAIDAYSFFKSERIFIVSSAGRPWMISRVKDDNVLWDHLFHFSEHQKDTAIQVDKDFDNLLQIVSCGAEDYASIIARKALFQGQRDMLQTLHERFVREEQQLERELISNV